MRANELKAFDQLKLSMRQDTHTSKQAAKRKRERKPRLVLAASECTTSRERRELRVLEAASEQTGGRRAESLAHAQKLAQA